MSEYLGEDGNYAALTDALGNTLNSGGTITKSSLGLEEENIFNPSAFIRGSSSSTPAIALSYSVSDITYIIINDELNVDTQTTTTRNIMPVVTNRESYLNLDEIGELIVVVGGVEKKLKELQLSDIQLKNILEHGTVTLDNTNTYSGVGTLKEEQSYTLNVNGQEITVSIVKTDSGISVTGIPEGLNILGSNPSYLTGETEKFIIENCIEKRFYNVAGVLSGSEKNTVSQTLISTA
ncbi:MAG: hypothetical protein ACD_79C00081G0001, partial [uncultured bacterium]